MGHNEAFLRDICENPDDDTPRLIYADWLQDHGDADRAEFIRLQCRLAAPDALDDPDRWELLVREEQLLRAHGKGWAGPLRSLVKRWRFRRGFVENITLPAATFLERGEELFRLAPIRQARLLGEAVEPAGRGPAGVQSLERLLPDLLESPSLARLRGLDLSNQLFGILSFEVLISSVHFPHLESLNLTGTVLCSDEGFRQLASCGPLESLTELILNARRDEFEGSHGGASINGEAMAALAHSPYLRKVSRLHLDGARDLTTDAIRALAAAPMLEQLTDLSLNRTFFDEHARDPLPELLNSPRVSRLRILRLQRTGSRYLHDEVLPATSYLVNLRRLEMHNCEQINGPRNTPLDNILLLPHLRELHLAGCRILDAGLQALAATRGLSKLAALTLDREVFSAETLRAFARSPLVENLRWLSLQGPSLPQVRFHTDHRLGDAAAAALAASPRMAKLVSLDLGNQRITDAGVRALAESPSLANLMALRLWYNEIGATGAQALLDPSSLPQLAELDLRSNPLSPSAKRALRQRFGYGVCYGRGPTPQVLRYTPADRFGEEDEEERYWA